MQSFGGMLQLAGTCCPLKTAPSLDLDPHLIQWFREPAQLQTQEWFTIGTVATADFTQTAVATGCICALHVGDAA